MLLCVPTHAHRLVALSLLPTITVLTSHRDPEDISRTKDRLSYWLWLAKLAEKGKITSIFIADSYGGHSIYGGSADSAYKVGILLSSTLLNPPIEIVKDSEN